MWNKTSRKFIAGFIGIIVATLTLLYFLNTYFGPERELKRRLAEIERLYAEDIYGGTTPEETLQLFINALKAGDIELASKYFLPDDQRTWQNKLANTKSQNLLTKFIENIEKSDSKDISKDRAILSYQIESDGGKVVIGDQELEVPPGIYTQTITFGKNGNGIWKITDM